MSKKDEMRKCVICGKKFAPKTANASVCSDMCRKALKAKHDKARKAAKKVAKVAPKKPVVKAVKGKAVEKIVLPKKPTDKKVVEKKVETKKPNTKINTIISVKNGNPFKVFVLATLIRDRAINEIVKGGHLFAS